MKLILAALILSLNLYAIEFSITKRCENQPALIENIEVLNSITVSELTHYVFKTFEIPFIGDERSINSILGTPTGTDAYEVMTDNEIKVYGWCFQVNGVQPDRFMNQIILDPTEQLHVNWFYGYAHYLNGVWITYCTPAYEQKSPFVCSN